jgi:hypothetical protein
LNWSFGLGPIRLLRGPDASGVFVGKLREMSGTLSPRVLLDRHLRGGPFTLRDDEERVATGDDLLHISDEMIWKITNWRGSREPAPHGEPAV